MIAIHCIRAVLAMAMLCCLAPATAARLDPALAGRLAAQPDPEARFEVIVSFHREGPPAAEDLALLRTLGMPGLSLRALPIVGVRATQAQIEALQARPEVRSLWFNAPLAYEGWWAPALGSGARRVTVGYDDRQTMSYSGRGVGVLVNDSGIDGTRPDLPYPARVVQNVTATSVLGRVRSLAPIRHREGIADTDSGVGHGTQVAAVIGASAVDATAAGPPGDRTRGVAPAADIIGYASGAGLSLFDTLGGFDYALMRQFDYNIRVVANAFGNPGDVGTVFDPDHPTNIATKALADRGVVVVFSAGNAGSRQATITGNFKKAPWVITVATGDRAGVSPQSSRGMPGVRGSVQVGERTLDWADRPTLVAAAAPTADRSSAGPHDGGTSMAASHVAGVVALMLQANPSLSWREVKDILEHTAHEIPGGESWEVGSGCLNPQAALAAAVDAGRLAQQ